MTKLDKLLNDIIDCENIKKSCNLNPCKKIIESQAIFENFHVPEPWNGDLKNCKILFIGSNPSINKQEEYPDSKWNKEDIYDFFINRFSKEKKWVKNELRPLLKNGKYQSPKNWVRFWGALRSIARTLLDTNKIKPGIDYAITEIVHCKSKSEIGVEEALETCAEKYLARILELTNAKIIICLGDKVSDFIKKRYSISSQELVTSFPMEDKLIMFLPHPNSRKERKLEKIFTEKKLSWIRNKLKK